MPNAEYIQPSELRYEILNESHNLNVFNCSHEDELGLNEFIHSDALQFQRENMGITYLFFYNAVIVGFATLAMSQLGIRATHVKLPFKTAIKDYPALMIGRLATDNNFRGRHVGENICLWCISKVQQLSKEIGCKLVIIQTNDKKHAFYVGCGFKMVPKFENKTKKWLYLIVSK